MKVVSIGESYRRRPDMHSHYAQSTAHDEPGECTTLLSIVRERYNVNYGT